MPFTPNPYSRYQSSMTMEDLFPTRPDGTCACGCGNALTGRKKRWASPKCQDKALGTFLLAKGDTGEIRRLLFERDKGICAGCNTHVSRWEADHIVPVHRGGGYCDLDNYQTLCVACHKAKTKREAR